MKLNYSEYLFVDNLDIRLFLKHLDSCEQSNLCHLDMSTLYLSFITKQKMKGAYYHYKFIIAI